MSLLAILRPMVRPDERRSISTRQRTSAVAPNSLECHAADQERGSVTGTKRVLLPLLFGLFAAASRIMVSMRSKKISANMIDAPS